MVMCKTYLYHAIFQKLYFFFLVCTMSVKEQVFIFCLYVSKTYNKTFHPCVCLLSSDKSRAIWLMHTLIGVITLSASTVGNIHLQTDKVVALSGCIGVWYSSLRLRCKQVLMSLNTQQHSDNNNMRCSQARRLSYLVIKEPWGCKEKWVLIIYNF